MLRKTTTSTDYQSKVQPKLLQLYRISITHASWWASLVAQMVKNLPATRETWVESLGQEDPPWRRTWQRTPVFLPEEFHGQRRPFTFHTSWWTAPLGHTEGTKQTYISYLRASSPETWLQSPPPHPRKPHRLPWRRGHGDQKGSICHQQLSVLIGSRQNQSNRTQGPF